MAIQADATFDMTVGDGTVPLGSYNSEKVSIQVNATGLNAADAVVTIQESNDNIVFVDLADNLGNKLEATLDASPTKTIMLKTDIGMSQFFRASIVRGAVTTGDLEFFVKTSQ